MLEGRVHDGLLKQIEAHIRGDDSCRCAVLVTGIPLAGKKTLCQRAAGFADLVPYLHVTDESAGFLQLANTIARWFQYVDVDDIRSRAFSVLEHLEKRRWSRAHDECINLVNLALEVGLRACFIIDRVQFLDDFSVSLVRECLLGRSNFRLSHSGSGISERSDLSNADLGKICFFLVHVALYDSKSASNMVADITRSQKSLDIPIVMVGEARRDELRQLCLDLSDIAADERWIDAFSEASGNCAGYFVERDATIQKLTGKIWSEGQRGYVEITEKLVMSIPPGGVRAAKKLSVREISAEVAMCFSQVFDGLPPLFQTFCKVLTVASRTGFFKLPRAVMWEVLNDLIADGVEAGVFNVVIDEMLDMCLIKIDFEGGAEVLSFQCPALGDIAFDVSTPIQVNSIGNALIERLEPHLLDDFKVPFVVANLHVLVGDGEGLKDELWVQGYRAFMQVSMEMDKADVCKWKESMHDEIQAMGCLHPADILGEEFHIPCSSAKPAISEQFTLIKMYHAPISFSVMGHSLGVICRNVYHEYGAFHGYSKESAFEVRSSMTSACCRYLKEMDVLEEFLSEHGFPEPSPELQKERDMMNAIAAPASSDIDVERKASLLLEEFVPQFVESRLKRLYALVGKLHEGDIPAVVQRSEDAIRLAYEALRSSKCRSDAAQDALMIMATRNWKPKTVPEFLPLLYYQTVARIRNRVLKRLSDPELYIFKHRQTYLDLEAFLIVTPLFYEAQAEGKC